MGVRSLKMKLQAFQLRNLLRPFWYNPGIQGQKLLFSAFLGCFLPLSRGVVTP